jgi:tRNA(Ile)-lysidine synthase
MQSSQPAWQMPFTLGRADLRGLKKSSPEERARNARLNFLFRVARKTGAGKIALGHNLDDQAETVLMRILRGTGLYGLAAILPKREISGFQIIRPLLEVSRKEIEAFLRRKKIRTRLDPTNLQDIYFRNKIRNKLLPLLRKDYNKNIKEVLANMAQSSGYDYDYLQRKASAMLKARNTRIPSKRLIRLHPAIRRLVIRQAIARVKGDTRRITFRHILEVEDLTFNRPVNSIVDMPKGISVKKDKNNLVFYRRRRRSYS